MARVGVLVPVHGVTQYLPQALDSALSQAPSPDEVVVVDDGSPEPVRLEERHAERCRLVRRERRGGPAAARQTGLTRVGTDLIALLDADDVWHPGKLAVQLEALESHPEVAVCFGRVVVVDADGTPTGASLGLPVLPAGPVDPDAAPRLFFEGDPVPTSTAVVRRTALDRAGGFDAGIEGDWDWDLWLRLVERGERFFYEPRAVVDYRRHPANLTQDIARTAELALVIQEAHAGLVDEETRRRSRAGHLTFLARGRIRQRRYAEARAALLESARLEPLGRRERILTQLVRVPGLRAGLGRRRPFPHS